MSPDCRRARDRLLIGHHDWPGASQDTKRHWLAFLDVIGVVDGLRPRAGRLARQVSLGYVWDSLLRQGKASEGLDEDWCAEVAGISFSHPYTNYGMRGQAWRLPGQIEHDQLPDTAKVALSTLVFDHLKARGNTSPSTTSPKPFVWTADPNRIIEKINRGYQALASDH